MTCMHACTGWEALVKSEDYSEVSVFDVCAFQQFDAFFSGEDEEDRQYLLLNGIYVCILVHIHVNSYVYIHAYIRIQTHMHAALHLDTDALQYARILAHAHCEHALSNTFVCLSGP
jgi:hypothetical protein